MTFVWSTLALCTAAAAISKQFPPRPVKTKDSPADQWAAGVALLTVCTGALGDGVRPLPQGVMSEVTPHTHAASPITSLCQPTVITVWKLQTALCLGSRE